MAEAVLNYSPVAPAITPSPPPNDRRCTRAAEYSTRRLSPTFSDMASGTRPRHEGVFTFDLADHVVSNNENMVDALSISIHRSLTNLTLQMRPREIAMNTLRLQCPAASREVDSGISAHRSTRLISIRARCPICEDVHEWQVADGTLGTVLSAANHSNGARLTNARSELQDFQGASTEIIELREQLLDELNHRLKNNLQILYGLLQTACRKTNNSEAREVLADTSRRIGAMGAAQQIFYSARHSTDVSGQRFLEAVCTNARVFFGNEVSINYEATTGSLPKETAVPLALVLNELLTNSAKYGANDRGRVTINVGLSQRSGSHELYVQDRGPGFSFEEAQGRSSGLEQVTKLAQRLKGTFTVERKSGARCTLRFPD